VNIVAKTINSAAIKVTWQTPLYPNGEINYRLYYWLSSEGVGTKRLAYNGPSLEHTVAGLQEFLTYTLMLQAYNATETIRPAGETFIVYNTRFLPGRQYGQFFFFFLLKLIFILLGNFFFLVKLIFKLLYLIQNPCSVLARPFPSENIKNDAVSLHRCNSYHIKD